MARPGKAQRAQYGFNLGENFLVHDAIARKFASLVLMNVTFIKLCNLQTSVLTCTYNSILLSHVILAYSLVCP